MEITEEFAKSNELNENQVKAVNDFISNSVAELKNEYKGSANENAEKIIQGAIDSTVNTFGLDIRREEGEKNAEFLARVNKSVVESTLSTEKKEIANLRAKYEEDLKNGKFDERLKADLEEANENLIKSKKEAADLSAKIETMVSKEDYETLSNNLSTMKRKQAFNSVKPRFAEGVNEYEARAKWGEFETEVLNKYDIEFSESGEALFKDKENEYKVGKLKDLVDADESIQGLVKGRQLTGTGAKQSSSTITIENVPFEVPQDISTPERSKLINNYLIKHRKELKPGSSAYANEFSKYNKLIYEAQTSKKAS